MSSASRDIALDALFHPFAEGLLQWPAGEVLFLRAREGAALHASRSGALVATQPFKPEADRLQRIGVTLLDEDALPAAAYPLVLLLPPRQREEARALLAKACAAVAPGGTVVIATSNDEGGKTREAELKQLAGSVGTLSKFHCRVAWARPQALDAALAGQWRAGDRPRTVSSAQVPGGGFRSRPGVFAWDRIDPASALLAAQLPADLAGRGADLGAGWGYLSDQVLACAPAVAALDLYEAQARALELARANLAAQVDRVALGFHWHDVTTGLARSDYDFIVSNPPFHAHDRGDRPQLGQRFIEVAAQSLRRGGRLLLVANRHLPYEATLVQAFGSLRVLAEGGGFKVIEAVKG